MAEKGTYRLEKSPNGKWEIWREGAKRPFSTHTTKADAQARMRSILEPETKSAVSLPANAARKPAVSAVLKNLELLSPEDLLQVAQKVEYLANSRPIKSLKQMETSPEAVKPNKKPLKSALGACKDLGPGPTLEEFQAFRKELWRKFPREISQ